ncbi:MAG: PilW family protein [Gammaproteobacteria bacterium]|nr:PilW family protein [Gammaproteobacteria bacterium]
MVAVAVSAILLVGVGIIYGNSKHTYTVDEEFAHLQESARIAMKFLVEDIRMAGYMGCALNDGDVTKFQCYLNPNKSFACDNAARIIPIQGFEATNAAININTSPGGSYTILTTVGNVLATSTTRGDWATLPGTGLPAAFPITSYPPVLGSDIVIVRHADTQSVRVDIGSNTAQLQVVNIGNITPNDIAIASSCNLSRVFQVTSTTNTPAIVHAGGGSTPGNINTPWIATDFNPGDDVMRFVSRAYFIAISGTTNEPGLFRLDGNPNSSAEELVDGVENMQILYGVDTDTPNDGIANRYMAANSVDFDNPAQPVVSVRISLLMRSQRDIPGYPAVQKSYTLLDSVAGTTIKTSSTKPDRRLRKIFTTTIKLRNKGLGT